MENAGAKVHGIVFNGMRHPIGAMIESAQFLVWAKYETTHTDPKLIDESIEDQFVKSGM